MLPLSFEAIDAPREALVAVHGTDLDHRAVRGDVQTLDEAIRLADRIAIMQDGAIVQTGAPEDLVTRPATPYVAEFTREIPRATVLSARAVMSPANGAGGYAGSVPATAKLDAIARRVIDAGRPFAVTDEGGRVIGQLERRAVLDVLAAPGDHATHG